MKKTLEGVVVNLSKANKYTDKDSKVHILHCECLKEGLYQEERSTKHYFPLIPVNNPDCKICRLFPWERNINKGIKIKSVNLIGGNKSDTPKKV